VNLTQAVTPESKFVGLSSHAVFAAAETHCKRMVLCGRLSNAHIKSKLPRMRVFGCAVRHDHLRERETVKQWAQEAIVVVRDRRERNPLTMIKSYVSPQILAGCRSSGSAERPPMCIFHFCHSSTWPSTLKLTPSGCTICKGLGAARCFHSFPSLFAASSMRSGRNSWGARGGEMRERCESSKASLSSGGGCVDVGTPG